jgi:hypothetical protein
MAIISIPTSIGGVALPGKLGSVASGPLAALYGSRALPQLNYPTELSTDATKSHYVTFAIKQVVPATYEGAVKSGANLTLNNGTKLANGVRDLANNGIGKAAVDLINETTGKLSPELTNLGSKTVNAIATGLEEGIEIKPSVVNLGAVISLYMPDSLVAQYNAQYNDVNLTDELGSTINTLRAIDQLAGKGIDAASGGGVDLQTAKKVWGSISTDPAAIGLVTNAVTGKLGTGGDIGNILLQGQGYAVNPQVQMLYKGLGLRSFSLSFVFSPKSQQEAKTVNEIIHTFKFHAAPTLTSGATVSSQSMYLIPPSLFNVSFMSKGKENTFLPKYADCVLEGIDVNFAPNGFAAHTDNAPVQTTLTLQFRETEIVDRARLQKGFNNSDATGLR